MLLIGFVTSSFTYANSTQPQNIATYIEKTTIPRATDEHFQTKRTLVHQYCNKSNLIISLLLTIQIDVVIRKRDVVLFFMSSQQPVNWNDLNIPFNIKQPFVFVPKCVCIIVNCCKRSIHQGSAMCV